MYALRRFWLLRSVVRGCPFDTVTGLLLNTLRSDMMRHLSSPPYHNSAVLEILFELLADLKNYSQDTVLERHELHMGVLTFYRALLLKEKSLIERGRGAVTGVWSPAELSRMDKGYLTPLRKAMHGGDDVSAAAAASGSVSVRDPSRSTSDSQTALWLLASAVDPIVELMAAPPKHPAASAV